MTLKEAFDLLTKYTYYLMVENQGENKNDKNHISK